MYFSLDEGWDYWRLFLVITCLVTAYLMAVKFRKNSKTWNTKTRDYWFALFMWNLAGLIASAEAIVQDLEAGSRLVFITAASVVSIFGLARSGPWGGEDD